VLVHPVPHGKKRKWPACISKKKRRGGTKGEIQLNRQTSKKTKLWGGQKKREKKKGE